MDVRVFVGGVLVKSQECAGRSERGPELFLWIAVIERQDGTIFDEVAERLHEAVSSSVNFESRGLRCVVDGCDVARHLDEAFAVPAHEDLDRAAAGGTKEPHREGIEQLVGDNYPVFGR